jgi:hypothetical protein
MISMGTIEYWRKQFAVAVAVWLILLPIVRAESVVTLAVNTADLTYTVHITEGAGAVQPGLAPRGAVAFLKTADGAFLGCDNPEKGWSSSRMSSGGLVVKPHYKRLSEKFTSTQKITDVLLGLHLCVNSKEFDKLQKLKLLLTIRVRANGVEAVHTADTGWFDVSDAMREAIKRKVFEKEK